MGTSGILSIFRYARASEIPYVLGGSSFVIIAALGSPVQTFIYGKVFQKLANFLSGHYSSPGVFQNEIRQLCGLIISVGAIRMIFTWLGIMGWLLVGERTSRRARRLLFESLLSKRPEWFLEQHNLVGSLTVVYRCIEEIRCGVSENIGLFVQTTASILFYFGSAMYASWMLTLVVTAVFPLMAASSFIFGRMISRFAQRENRLCAGAAKVLDWCFAHPDTMRVLNGKKRDENLFGRLMDQSAQQFRSLSVALNANSAVLKLLGNLVVLAALLVGNFLIQKHKVSLGMVVTAFSSCLLLGTSVASVADIFSVLNKAHAACRTIDSSSCWTGETDPICVSDQTQPSPESTSSSWSIESFASAVPSLSVRGVSYSYGAGTALESASADFSPHQLNFIVGPSGCGKSTLACILAGFLPPDTGSVAVGKDVVSRDQLASLCTLVESHAMVFPQSLYRNLQLAVPDLEKASFEAAVFFADLDELRNRSVLVSENLSGGQLQKINLARAFVKDRPILILDEALGSINNTTRTAILGRLRQWRKDKMTILVTHDLTDIRPCDHVVYMADGRVCSTRSPTERPATEQSAGPVSRVQPASSQGLEPAAATVSAGLFTLLRFWYRTSAHKGWVWLGLGCALCAGVIPPVLAFCYSRCLSAIVARAAYSQGARIGMWASVAAAVAVAEMVVEFASKMSLDCAAEAWVVHLRKKCLHTVNRQDMSFFDTQKASDLNTLLLNDTRDLRHLTSAFLSGMLLVVSLTVVGVVWATIIGWRLALAGVAFVPLVLVVTVVYSGVLSRLETSYKDAVAAAEKHVHTAVAAIRTVHSYELAPAMSRDYSTRLGGVYRLGVFRAISGGFGVALSEFCTSATTGVVLYYGVSLVAKGAYSQEQLISVLTMLTFTVTSAAAMASQLPEIARGQRAGTHIMQLLALAPSPAEAPVSQVKMPISPLGLRLRDVCFAFPNRDTSDFCQVLRGVSLDVGAGETVAITGPSGCGKSTLVRLVSRLYMPDRGAISVCNIDVNALCAIEYRSAVVLELQEPQFFEGTVLANLTYGVGVRTEQEIVRCIQDANAGFVLETERGLQTEMKGGKGFSAGQMRRLSIARALLRDPQVLLFDEPTARLDAACIQSFCQLLSHNSRLRQTRPTLTVVVVTHDTHVMQSCGRVVVLDAGRVTADDHFDTLTDSGALASIC